MSRLIWSVCKDCNLRFNREAQRLMLRPKSAEERLDEALEDGRLDRVKARLNTGYGGRALFDGGIRVFKSIARQSTHDAAAFRYLS